MNTQLLKNGTISLNGYKIHMLQSNQQHDGIPIILVHGLAVSSRYMEPLAEELAKTYTVYAPDLPGFGKSTDPKNTLTIQQLTDILMQLMKKLGIKKAVLLGNSFGCQIVVDFAVRYPKMLTHAILAGPTMDEKDRTFLQQTMRLFADLPREPISYIPVILRESIDVGLHRILKNTDYSLEDPVEKKLPKINVPTLVIRGEKDPIVPQRWTDTVAKSIPHAKSVTIPKAGHVINYNSPKKFSEHIALFLKEF
jgi:2-hydroxy-6-oxonona-2,4-dienedioate hydrolase